MHTLFTLRRPLLATAGITTAFVIACGLIQTAHAASSWNPTLLVNTESFEMIDRGDGATDIELRFGTSTQTLKFLTTGRFQFSHPISVLGTISGSSLNIDRNATIGGGLTVTGAILSLSSITARGTLSGNVLAISHDATISGSLLVKNNIAAKGTVSGATITGFGLGSCNGADQKLVYNSGTQKFECGTITSPTPWSSTGALQTAFDSRFVNQSGDTMTGALTINLSSGFLGLNVKQMLSGSVIHAEKSLTSSGTILSVGNITTRGTASGNALTFMGGTSYILGSLGIGTTSPKTKFSVVGTISGSALNVDRNATVGGSLTVTGAILSKSNITAKGNLSGSTLTVDGNVTIHGQTYTFPTTQPANGYLKTDGAGNLTWAASAIGNSSGSLLSLHPEYPNAIYFSSGSSFIGQLSASGGVAGVYENYYHWTSTKTTKNDYWISVRVRLPDNFSSWDPVKPIELRYRTGSGQTLAQGQGSYLTVRMRDTANASVALTGGSNLANTSFTTATITGPQAGGGQTWTPKGYFTVYIRMAGSTTPNGNWFADAGFLNLNFETTVP